MASSGDLPAAAGAVADGRSKEAMGMMALHEALRNVCLNSDWTYSVFWTIRPRPRCRGGNGCKVGDDNGSLMLMWEDGFCRTRAAEGLEDIDGEDPVRKAFSKMSIQLYNYGEGLMGKVASDKCHKWVFKEPSECEPNISNYWQSSFDALPPEWTDQFASGIQTIAVIQAGHGLLQLGSCKIIPEDLHFVLRMRHMFESLGYQSGYYFSQLFSATRSSSTPSPSSFPKQLPTRSPPPMFNWNQRPLPSASSMAPPGGMAPGGFHPAARMGIHGAHNGSSMDDPSLGFLLPRSSDAAQMDDMIPDHDAELKWPSGLSFFNALTARTEDAKLLFGGGGGGGGAEGLGGKAAASPQHPIILGAPNMQSHGNRAGSSSPASATSTIDSLGLENHSGRLRWMEGGGGSTSGGGKQFRRSFTMPARVASSSSSSGTVSSATLEHETVVLGTTRPVDYRSSEVGIYSDIMETFLD